MRFFGWRILDVHSTRIPKQDPHAMDLLCGLAFVASRVETSARTGRDVDAVEFRRNRDSQLLYLQDSEDRASLYAKAAAWPGASVFIGGRDLTIPRQIDTRFRQQLPPVPAVLASQLEAGRKKLFVENLDAEGSSISALPGGVLPSPLVGSLRVAHRGKFAPIGSNRRLLLCAHRVRSGPQWGERKRVSAIAASDWQGFATVAGEERQSMAEFNRLAEQHVFGLCVEGGGLTPSPKFFDLLLRQCIPVIRSSPISSVHSEHFPCVVVSNWSPNSLTAEFLREEYIRLREVWSTWDSVFDAMEASKWRDYVLRGYEALD